MEQRWTPNQAAKREEIVEAAVDVLRTQGVRACTARAVAAAGGLSVSVLHYYFSNTDEIIDLAFRKVMGQFFDRVEKAAADIADPVDALWTAVEEYMRRGGARAGRATKDKPGRAPMLWFEYQLGAGPEGKASLLELTERGERLFTGLVAATEVPDAEARAEILFSAMLGNVLRDDFARRDPAALVAKLALVTGIPARS